MAEGHPPSATIDAHSFEEAALTFMETWGEAGEACRVTVRDHHTGEQHCFSVDHEGALAEGC